MSTIRLLRYFGASVICAHGIPLASQTVQRCPVTADTVALLCELDVWPDSGTIRRAPRYPEILRQAGVEGRVQASYIVDTTGRVVHASFKASTSTHDLFAQAVRQAVADHRFGTLRRAGLAVAVRVEEVITFVIPDVDTLPVVPPISSVDTAGRFLTIVTAPGRLSPSVPFDSVNAPRLTVDDETKIYVAVVDELFRQRDDKPPPSAYCVHVGGTSPNAEFVKRWQRPGRRVVPSANCPPTYASMIARANDGRPTGWIDPVGIGVGRPRGWAKDMAVLEASVGQGTSTRYYRCEVSRRATGWGTVACTPSYSRMS